MPPGSSTSLGSTSLQQLRIALGFLSSSTSFTEKSSVISIDLFQLPSPTSTI